MLAAIESISIGESFALAGISIGIIMCVLACIMALIYLMTWAFRQLDKAKANRVTKAEAPSETFVEAPDIVIDNRPLAPGSCGDLKLFNVEPRDAAMLMAIVADSMETPLNELRFLSIKEVKGE